MIKRLPAIFSLLFVFVCACQNRQRNLGENTAIVHMAFKTKGLHPTNEIDATRAWIFDFTQRALIDVDIRNGQRIPSLLTHMPEISPDGTRMVFELRNDITWDNGEPFTVDDALFSIKILVCPLVNNPSYKSTYTSIFRDIRKDSLNPQRFVFYTNGFHRSNTDIFLEMFMLQRSKWDPSHLMDQYTVSDFLSPGFKPDQALIQWAEKFNGKETFTRLENLTGLGPYQITQWEPDSYLVLEKKKNWWGHQDSSILNHAYPDKIIFKLIMDDASVYYALKNQQIDATVRITTGKLLKLQKHVYFNQAYYSDFIDQYAYTYIGLNMRPDGIRNKPFFTSKKVRRAMAHLVPVDDLIKIFNKGKAQRMVTCVNPIKKEFNRNLKPIAYDPEKAIALLEQEGWRDTDGDNIRDKVINGEKVQFSFLLNYVNMVPGNKEMCLLIKDCMYRAGIDLKPNPLDFAQFYQECYNQTFDAELGAWLGGGGHEDFSQLFSTQSWTLHGENFCGFGNASTDSVLNACNRAQNDSVYLSLIYRFQEMMYDEQPYVFIMSPKNKVVLHQRFENTRAYVEKPHFYVNNFLLPTHKGPGIKPTTP